MTYEFELGDEWSWGFEGASDLIRGLDLQGGMTLALDVLCR